MIYHTCLAGIGALSLLAFGIAGLNRRKQANLYYPL